MEQDELADKELLAQAKKKKSDAVINAFLIGLMIGIVIYSIVKNGLGFFILIPILFIYKINNKSNNKNAQK